MSTYSLSELREKLKSLGIEPKKSLGQNFLVNKRSCESIVEAVRKLDPSQVVEVGPGLGALTEFFSPDQILLIELDSKLVLHWRERDYKVIEDDALAVDWSQLNLPPQSVVMSNLPYQISSRLVIDRSLGPQEISGMVLMFQKEVAQRLLAKPDTEAYGLLTVIASTYWKMDKLFEISSKDFYPPPQVASQVVVFRRNPVDLPVNFIEFVKLAFSQRRKFLVKNLSARYSQTNVKAGLAKLGLDEKVRAEVLSPQQLQDLYKSL